MALMNVRHSSRRALIDRSNTLDSWNAHQQEEDPYKTTGEGHQAPKTYWNRADAQLHKIVTEPSGSQKTRESSIVLRDF